MNIESRESIDVARSSGHRTGYDRKTMSQQPVHKAGRDNLLI
jgi:hypothetical protein